MHPTTSGKQIKFSPFSSVLFAAVTTLNHSPIVWLFKAVFRICEVGFRLQNIWYLPWCLCPSKSSSTTELFFFALNSEIWREISWGWTLRILLLRKSLLRAAVKILVISLSCLCFWFVLRWNSWKFQLLVWFGLLSFPAVCHILVSLFSPHFSCFVCVCVLMGWLMIFRLLLNFWIRAKTSNCEIIVVTIWCHNLCEIRSYLFWFISC